MKQIKILIGAAAVAMSASAWAMEPAKPLSINETHEQKCNRYADYDNLQGEKRSEFVKDCLIELKVPDTQESGGDE